jgi:hypothetical protein
MALIGSLRSSALGSPWLTSRGRSRPGEGRCRPPGHPSPGPPTPPARARRSMISNKGTPYRYSRWCEGVSGGVHAHGHPEQDVGSTRGMGKPMHSSLLVCLQKFLSRKPGLCADCSQGGASYAGVIWHCQRRSCAVGVLTGHRNVFPLSDGLKPQTLECSDNPRLRGINGKLRHQMGTPASATKASSTGDSDSSTSRPNVSM